MDLPFEMDVDSEPAPVPPSTPRMRYKPPTHACTSGCTLLFHSKEAWAAHEQKIHDRAWFCKFVGDTPGACDDYFYQRKAFEEHVARKGHEHEEERLGLSLVLAEEARGRRGMGNTTLREERDALKLPMRRASGRLQRSASDAALSESVDTSLTTQTSTPASNPKRLPSSRPPIPDGTPTERPQKRSKTTSAQTAAPIKTAASDDNVTAPKTSSSLGAPAPPRVPLQQTIARSPPTPTLSTNLTRPPSELESAPPSTLDSASDFYHALSELDGKREELKRKRAVIEAGISKEEEKLERLREELAQKRAVIEVGLKSEEKELDKRELRLMREKWARGF